MKKRILSIVLTICMVLAFMPQTAFAETSGSENGLNYTISDAGEVTITGYNGSDGAVKIPATINGNPVTAIGSKAFSNKTTIKSVTIPNTVTTIGNQAFMYCIKLTSITIPSSVTSIGNNAFNNCGLTSVIIPGNVQTISCNAFTYCSSLTSITIQTGVKNIETGAFQNCESLASIEIPSSVTTIGNISFNNVFNGCKSLTSINVDDSNTAYSSVDGVLFNKDKTELTKYPEGKDGNGYIIPDGVTSIRNSAFSDCTSLTDVTIPSSVTSIGNDAFSGCTSLTGVTIPSSVTSIGNSAFFGCTSLTGVTIPNGVTSIGNNAFEECINLTNIEIPNSVTNIGHDAFDPHYLNSIFLPDGLDVSSANIRGEATQVKYSLDTQGEVTITEINLGIGRTGVALPDTICGYDVVAISDASLLTKISSHTCAGGQATCQSKAACGICGKKYGEIDSTNHNLENIPAKNATVTETGNKEYWHCKDCGKYFSDENGKSEINDLAAWKAQEGKLAKLPPEIINGKGMSITAGEAKELTFRSNADFSDFIRVELDGKTLDAKYYTAKEGSTIITLKADYVASLPAGDHTIGIVSTSGTATTEFTINAQAASDKDSPKTGDNSNLLLWLALMILSASGTAGAVAYFRKNRTNK